MLTHRARPNPSEEHSHAQHSTPIGKSRSSKLRVLAALTLAASTSLWAQNNNSFATMIQNNAARQANLTSQMFPLGGAPATGSSRRVAPADRGDRFRAGTAGASDRRPGHRQPGHHARAAPATAQ